MSDVAPSVVVMGVSASGKTTLARKLAAALGARFIEGDDLHPAANRAAMSQGRPLTDAMRAPWLAAIASAIRAEQAAGHRAVVSCSALKQSYRDDLRARAEPLCFLFLDGPRALLEERIHHRHGHFMPPSLLDSQLATLEPPGRGETDTARLSFALDPEALLTAALAALDRLAGAK